MTRVRTLRGQGVGGVPANVVLADDGDLSHGWTIEQFWAWSSDGSRFNCSLNTLGGSGGMRPQENTQIGWASSETWDGPKQGVLDPLHLIVRDLFLQCVVTGDAVVNYMLVMTRRPVSDVEAVTAIIKETAQNANTFE